MNAGFQAAISRIEIEASFSLPCLGKMHVPVDAMTPWYSVGRASSRDIVAKRDVAGSG